MTFQKYKNHSRGACETKHVTYLAYWNPNDHNRRRELRYLSHCCHRYSRLHFRSAPDLVDPNPLKMLNLPHLATQFSVAFDPEISFMS